MEVKIICSCGTKYVFDVEPVEGRMPYGVKCPACGLDGERFANEIIQHQLMVAKAEMSAKPAAPDLPITKPESSSQPQTPVAEDQKPKVAVRKLGGTNTPVALSKKSDAPAGANPFSAPPSTSADTARDSDEIYCPRHPQDLAVEKCRACGKDLCLTCMEQFGYVCSVNCRYQAEQRGIRLPVYKFQAQNVRDHEWSRIRNIALVVGAACIIALGAWAYYSFSLSQPKLALSIKVPKTDPTSFRLHGDGKLLQLGGEKITALDLKTKKPVWMTTLPGEANAPLDNRPNTLEQAQKAVVKKSAAEGDDLTTDLDTRPKSRRELWSREFEEPPRVRVTSTDIWFLSATHLLRFDPVRGTPRDPVPIPQPVLNSDFTDDGLLTVSDGPQRLAVTRVDFKSGAVEKETIPKPIETARTPKKVEELDSPDVVDLSAFIFANDYIPSGSGVTKVDVELIEKKLVAVQAMRERTKPALTENLSAGGSLGAAVDLLSEMKKDATGGVRMEDHSRYKVTLRRHAQGTVPPLELQVTGRPAFFAGKAVDLLVAGKLLVGISKANTKVWEVKLTYPIATQFGARDQEHPPFLETDKAILFFDQGMLSHIDPATGNVRWRLPSVGIRSVDVDSAGLLYVCSSSATPEMLKFSEEMNFQKNVYPVLLKIDPSNGKMLWKTERIGEKVYLSGKYVYATKSSQGSLDRFNAMVADEDAAVHFRLMRINPKNGKTIWEHYQKSYPDYVQVMNRYILLQTRNGADVLSYFAF